MGIIETPKDPDGKKSAQQKDTNKKMRSGSAAKKKEGVEVGGGTK